MKLSESFPLLDISPSRIAQIRAALGVILAGLLGGADPNVEDDYKIILNPVTAMATAKEDIKKYIIKMFNIESYAEVMEIYDAMEDGYLFFDSYDHKRSLLVLRNFNGSDGREIQLTSEPPHEANEDERLDLEILDAKRVVAEDRYRKNTHAIAKLQVDAIEEVIADYDPSYLAAEASRLAVENYFAEAANRINNLKIALIQARSYYEKQAIIGDFLLEVENSMKNYRPSEEERTDLLNNSTLSNYITGKDPKYHRFQEGLNYYLRGEKSAFKK